MRVVTLVMALVLVAGACGDDDATSSTVVTTTTAAASTTGATSAAGTTTTTTSSSTTTGTQAATTTAAATTTTAAPSTTVAPSLEGFDLAPKGVFSEDFVGELTDVRFGSHDGFDRAVFEFADAGTPLWFAEYAIPPISDYSGEGIVPVAGDSFLTVDMGTITWPVEAYFGPTDLTPGTGIFEDAVMAWDFEGGSRWVLGMTGAPRPFKVFTLGDPTRLVVDIATGAGASALSLLPDGLGQFSFGADPDAVVGDLTARFGPPDFDEGWEPVNIYPCHRGTEIRFATWDGAGLSVTFTDATTNWADGRHFANYVYFGGSADLATPNGLTVGTTSEELLALHPDATITPFDNTGIATFYDLMEGYLGELDADPPGSVVTSVRAGTVICGE